MAQVKKGDRVRFEDGGPWLEVIGFFTGGDRRKKARLRSDKGEITWDDPEAIKAINRGGVVIPIQASLFDEDDDE